MKKETVTEANIKEDIAVFFRHRPELAEQRYRAANAPCFAVMVAVIILQIFAPGFLLLPLVVVFFSAVAAMAYINIREGSRIRNCRPEDYEITRALLSHKEEECYKQTKGRHFLSRRTVHRYLLHFEGGATWDIPDKLYPWSEENKTGSYFIYENASRGAAYILVTEKKSGRVAVAYPEEFFTYERS